MSKIDIFSIWKANDYIFQMLFYEFISFGRYFAFFLLIHNDLVLYLSDLVKGYTQTHTDIHKYTQTHTNRHKYTIKSYHILKQKVILSL